MAGGGNAVAGRGRAIFFTIGDKADGADVAGCVISQMICFTHVASTWGLRVLRLPGRGRAIFFTIGGEADGGDRCV